MGAPVGARRARERWRLGGFGRIREGLLRHLDRLDKREHASVEGGAADAERLRRLRPAISEPLDVGRLANDDSWRRRLRGRRVTLRFRVPAPETTARHPYSVHEL